MLPTSALAPYKVLLMSTTEASGNPAPEAKKNSSHAVLGVIFLTVFLDIVGFSILFPIYQKYQGKAMWTRFYPSALLIFMAYPVFMMPGTIRPIVAGLMVASGLVLAGMQIKRGTAAQ